MAKSIYIFLLPIFTILLVAGCSKPGSKEFSEGVMKAIEDNPEKVFSIITDYAQKEAMNRRKGQVDKEQESLEAQFKNPLKPSTSDRPILGAKNAPITIVEYSDFECPYCSRAQPTMEKILKEYKGKVKLIFKHLPLPFHAQALPAAKAAVAAGNQGKFYEYHDELFKNNKKLSDKLYTDVAKKLNLNLEKFNKDMASAATAKIIKEDEAEARKFNISGTPGFIINGVALKGAYPFEQFKMIIDRHLAKN
jgi:protein-disulfide isomerase